MNSEKKISFGFNKQSKKSSLPFNPSKKSESVELIDCLEGAEIKVKNAMEKVEESPLIIPIKGNANNIVSQIERASLKSKKIKTEKSDEDLRPDSELTIEELAARQLLREARNKLTQDKDTTKVHSLPLDVTETIQEGVESSMEDYENVPIGDFGLACLRGMGWKEGMFCGKNQSKSINKPPEPDLRPKGLGLGAQKIIEVETKDVFDKNGKKLVLAKGAYGKITAGSHIGKFCEVQFCDEWSGRVVVKTSNDNAILTINQLFVLPISKDDFICGSKVINNAKYEQYKQIEENKGSSKDNISNDKRKHSSGKKSASNDSQITKNEKVLTEESPDNYKVKIEHEMSVTDEFVKMEKSSCDDEFERENNVVRTTKDLSYQKESKKSYKENRDKYSKRIKERSHDYHRESSEEYVRKSKKKIRSSSSDSSDSYKSSQNRRYERSRSRDRHEYYEKKKPQKKNRSASEDSSEKCDRNKSKIRSRRKVRSSSEEYDNRFVEKQITLREESDKKYTKDKRSEKKYSRYSDDDYKMKYTRKEKSKEDKSRRKHKSKKNKKCRKDSSSE